MSELRYELKMVCPGECLGRARSWIRLHPIGFKTAYPSRQVNNIYLDTPTLESFSATQMGISRREKLRLRWYGTSIDRIQPWLELKSKESFLSEKRRVLIPCTLDLKRTWSEVLSTVRDNLPVEWKLKLNGLVQPTLYNHYRREYYVTIHGEIRVTLDYHMGACDQRFRLRPDYRRSVPIGDSVVVEVKGVPEEINRLQEIISRFPIPRGRNSKYVTALSAAILTQ
jgi:hypothetical protein